MLAVFGGEWLAAYSGLEMIRALLPLILAFKIWMAIDAGRKRLEYYWFMIIFFVPFGAVAYFFVHKLDEFNWRKLAALFRSPPPVDQLKYRYRDSPSLDNRLALARGLADTGRHVEAIVDLEGILASRPNEHAALWGLGMSRAALGELEEASSARAKLVSAAPSYGDWEPWVMLAGIQHKRGLRQESLETLRMLVRKSARDDYQMLLAEALIAAERYDEADGMLERIIEDHDHAPDFIRRRDRRVAACARRQRVDMARASGRAARGASSNRPTAERRTPRIAQAVFRRFVLRSGQTSSIRKDTARTGMPPPVPARLRACCRQSLVAPLLSSRAQQPSSSSRAARLVASPRRKLQHGPPLRCGPSRAHPGPRRSPSQRLCPHRPATWRPRTSGTPCPYSNGSRRQPSSSPRRGC